jgi:hypothetical protein
MPALGHYVDSVVLNRCYRIGGPDDFDCQPVAEGQVSAGNAFHNRSDTSYSCGHSRCFIVRQQILVLCFAIVWSAGSKGFAERDPMDYTILVRCVGSDPAREVVRDAPFTGGGLSVGDDVAEWTGHFDAGPDDLTEARFVMESGPLIPARIEFTTTFSGLGI